MSSLYKFDIQNSTVAAVYEYEHGRFRREGIDRNESWVVNGTQVIKTETEHGQVKTTVFTDDNGDRIYSVLSSTSAAVSSSTASLTSSTALSGYKFAIVNGAVTVVYVVEHGVAHQERIDSNETWTIQGSNVVKTEVDHGVTETSVYSDTDGDGVYLKVSSSSSLSSTTGTSLATVISIVSQDGLKFDVVNGTVVAVYEIEHGVVHQKAIDSNETWAIQGANVVNTEIDHGVTKTSIYSDGDGDGIYTQVQQQISLIGLQSTDIAYV